MKKKILNILEFLKKHYILLLIIIIILQVLNVCYYCDKKSGYHIDEIYSYNLSNSYETTFIKNYKNLYEWNSGEYFDDILSLNEDNEFSYPKVIRNQKNDTHPPLYYLIIHTL